jgi:methyl-accepting chemotaxis protein
VPALQLEDMSAMQGIQTTIAQTAEALRQQITEDASQARERATSDADAQVRTLLWVIAIVGFGIVGFGLWLAGRLVRRVKMTAEVLGRVAEGDLTPRLEDAGKDEVGEMATALNTTLGTVQDVMGQLGTDVEELSAFAEQSSAQSATAAAATNQIANYVRTMRTATTGMANRAERLASMVELGDALRPEHRADLAREIGDIALQARKVAEGLGDKGLGRAAEVSSVIVARNQAAADRLAEMAATLDAMLAMFVIEAPAAPTVAAGNAMATAGA